ncbi:hypothetical protein FACS1894152_7970 [Bacilli bacterium]|nr:hypothetical protein FACS1894152_7970 [Bacilli bacterium]
MSIQGTLNPIERLWKVMNEYTRNNRVFKDFKEFTTTVMNFFNETWKDISQTMRGRINDNFEIMKKPVIVG